VLLHHLGRWNRYGPIGFAADDFNLYRYVGNAPVSALDYSGLWKSGDHKDLTRRAFEQAMNQLNRKDSKKCRSRLLDKPKKYNLMQDKEDEYYADRARHYSRSSSTHYVTANKAYRKYTTEEEKRFYEALGVKVPKCEAALKSLGLLTHSWQDYFAHAVLQSGKPGPAWSATPPIKGNPDSLNAKLKACSYDSWHHSGEHGWFEPAYDDGETGADLRKDDAVYYVKKRYLTMLAAWFDKCGCYCE
jgi:hypothetical protein